MKEKVELAGFRLVSCPLKPFMPGSEDYDGVHQILWYYGAYKRGMLPNPGGLLDQPKKLMDYFKIIDGAMAAVEGAERDKATRKATRGGRKGSGGAHLVPIDKD